MLIYWFYGRIHSPLADRAEQARRTDFEQLANTVTMFGYLAIFNAFAMTLLGFMTELGLTTENTAKWHEVGLTAHQADMFGLGLLGAAIAITLVGRGLQAAARRSTAG
jgi:hypothetical protein